MYSCRMPKELCAAVSRAGREDLRHQAVLRACCHCGLATLGDGNGVKSFSESAADDVIVGFAVRPVARPRCSRPSDRSLTIR